MKESHDTQIDRLLGAMQPISLEQMKSIRLMKRTDQKYVTDLPRLMQLLALTQESYFVQEIDGMRVSRYRTVYWDFPETHTLFRTHQCGRLPRTKVRARTYVDSRLSFLEIKKKNNHGKTSKSRIRVPSIEAVMSGEAGEDFLSEKTGLSFSGLAPAVGNRFRRITLVNRGKTERLTIDFDLRFDNFETGQDARMDSVAIIELKRDGRIPSPILPMLRKLRIKPSGFSKYCIGSCVTNDNLSVNRLKPRLRKIERIGARGTGHDEEDDI